MLIYFIADYLRNPELQLRASEDPAQVLAEYGITLDIQHALRRHDHAAILKSAHDELTALFTRPQDHDYVVAAWGPIDIEVTSVSPPTAKVNTPMRLTVVGRTFPPKGKARLAFRNEQSNQRVEGTIVSITTGPYAQSTLLGQVTLPTVGLWKVTVASVDQPAGAGEWNGDLHVTAG
ncbi:hypothetical protein WMF31_41650 [Sorangium sp. So ce1036]|uniref:hypothetical protein n=1 Tax=Sorangium sp. So ce1036 TaxID=3133328 RepID=UPI003EFFF75F